MPASTLGVVQERYFIGQIYAMFICRCQAIEEQKAVVAIHHTLEIRKAINEKLKESIKPLCPVLMCGGVQQLEQNTTKTA